VTRLNQSRGRYSGELTVSQSHGEVSLGRRGCIPVSHRNEHILANKSVNLTSRSGDLTVSQSHGEVSLGRRGCIPVSHRNEHVMANKSVNLTSHALNTLRNGVTSGQPLQFESPMVTKTVLTSIPNLYTYTNWTKQRDVRRSHSETKPYVVSLWRSSQTGSWGGRLREILRTNYLPTRGSWESDTDEPTSGNHTWQECPEAVKAEIREKGGMEREKGDAKDARKKRS
jgi:hypothetical protein